MNTRLVRCHSHGPTQGINFLDQMAFADPANSGVAAHLAQGVYIMGQQKSRCAGTRGCQCRFCPCMAASDHNNVVVSGVLHDDTQRYIEPCSIRLAGREFCEHLNWIALRIIQMPPWPS